MHLPVKAFPVCHRAFPSGSDWCDLHGIIPFLLFDWCACFTGVFYVDDANPPLSG
jgi:hypothetical protein